MLQDLSNPVQCGNECGNMAPSCGNVCGNSGASCGNRCGNYTHLVRQLCWRAAIVGPACGNYVGVVRQGLRQFFLSSKIVVRQRRGCASTARLCVNSCRVRQQLPRAATIAACVNSCRVRQQLPRAATVAACGKIFLKCRS